MQASSPTCRSCTIQYMDDIHDASENAQLIPKGDQCSFLGWDADGDILLYWNDSEHMVFKEDLSKLSLL